MPTCYRCRGKHSVMLFTQDSGFLRVSGRQKIGVLVSILWMVGLPICVMIDSNRRASEFYDMCRKVESNLGSDLGTEQQHEALLAMVTTGQRGEQRRRRRKIDYLFVRQRRLSRL